MAKLEPVGGVTTKRIKNPKTGKTYEYHYVQWTENGKQRARRISDEEFKKLSSPLSDASFHCAVIRGQSLSGLVAPVALLRPRNALQDILNYLRDPSISGKVFICYGLRRTGKTTLAKQAILSLGKSLYGSIAYIQVSKSDTMSDLNKDLRTLQENGAAYVFIDEITLLEDFSGGAALLSDIYASTGMKIVLMGTDSLGFYLAKSEELYDRCILAHTTFIPYREFEFAYPGKSIDEYIEYGGTMSPDGFRYNDFDKDSLLNEYVDTAIASNIQHSLAHYQDGLHFRHLRSLYDSHELTSAISRVVEDMNHRFALDVLTRRFFSHDLGIAARNARKSKEMPTALLDEIPLGPIVERLRKSLSILNPEERRIPLDESHVREIEEYLRDLDLVADIEIRSSSHAVEKRIAFLQPGLRYGQAKALIESLYQSPEFLEADAQTRKHIRSLIDNEVKGRMLEDIVLFETASSLRGKKVFKLQFDAGEFDMVVVDEDLSACELYEIKHSKAMDPSQSRHLMDEEKLSFARRQYGSIQKRAVLYLGPNSKNGDILYLNIEEYLKSLA